MTTYNYYITCNCDQGRQHTVKTNTNPSGLTNAEKIQLAMGAVQTGVTLMSVFASGEISDIE